MDTIVLDTTSKTVWVVLGEAVTTNQVDVTCHYADAATGSLTEGSSVARSNGTTAAQVLAAPAASTRRVVRNITLYNADTIGHNVTLTLRNVATDYVIAKRYMNPGDSWDFDESTATAFGTNLSFIDQSGGVSDKYGVLSGAIDGTNAVFTVSKGRYNSGSLKVYLNGQLRTQGTSEDWVETSPSAGTFTLTPAPPAGSAITATYDVAFGATSNADTVDGQHASAFMPSSTPVRDTLTADRTYYVSPTGSDSNDGLSAGAPFLTIQKAINTVATLDIRSYNVTIQLADGTYTAGGSVTFPWTGTGIVTIQGNSSTPANVIISTTSTSALSTDLNGSLVVKYMKLQTTTTGDCLYAGRGGIITYSNIDFGTCAWAHIRAVDGGVLYCDGNYTISGNALAHFSSIGSSLIRCQTKTITFSGTPAFTTAFYSITGNSSLIGTGIGFVGSCTGPQFSCTSNAVVNLIGTSSVGNSYGAIYTGAMVIDAYQINPFERYPDGTVLNGKISVSVASNNLTVALKTNAGNDPTQTSPVYVMINGNLRAITSALSVTKNAGTNWCNAGSAELATKPIDYFVYLIWNTGPATDVVDIGFARVPYFTVYSEASPTSTNEKYLAYGNATPPVGTDDMVNIGRFEAMLSAGAGYTWSVNAFTSTNLIQRPIFETRQLTYAPTISGYSAVPTNTYYGYKVVGSYVYLIFREATQGTSNNTSHTYTAPFTTPARTNMVWFIPLPIVENNAVQEAAGYLALNPTSNVLFAFRSAGATWTASGASRIVGCQGFYEIA